MSDEKIDKKIRAVLARAAEDRTFFDALMASRESALGAFDLSPEEKALLMAPTDDQLGKMIEKARKKPWYATDIGGSRVGCLATGGVVGALLLGLSSMSLGATARLSYVTRAVSALQKIAYAEQVYRNDHGSYGNLTDLVRTDTIDQDWVDDMVGDSPKYEIRLTVEGDTFTATARHRTRPDTRPAFRIGPDGEVKQVE
ncbi:MAG: hypothetical protein ACYS9X_11200 [Planctomycetota bacterium]|jgi:hypothetical protein